MKGFAVRFFHLVIYLCVCLALLCLVLFCVILSCLCNYGNGIERGNRCGCRIGIGIGIGTEKEISLYHLMHRIQPNHLCISYMNLSIRPGENCWIGRLRLVLCIVYMILYIISPFNPCIIYLSWSTDRTEQPTDQSIYTNANDTAMLILDYPPTHTPTRLRTQR
jgi:hypothetical protein